MTDSVIDPGLAEYRNQCVSAAQKSQDDYDKAVLSLSGGALGISFAFVKDVVGPGSFSNSSLLIGAWASWSISVAACLWSHWFSQRALREAIQQVDSDLVRDEKPGRQFAVATERLNVAGGVLFVVGVFLIGAFVYSNLRLLGRTSTERRFQKSELTQLLSVGPFSDADTALAVDVSNEFSQDFVRLIREKEKKESIENILVLGSVDRRALSPRAAAQFGSNEGLAKARAMNVRTRIIRLLNDSTVGVYVIPVGALELGSARSGLEYGRDRRVTIYAITRAPDVKVK